jgi:3-methylfumaryl-CoA hydratase
MDVQMDLPYLRQWIGRDEYSDDILTPALAARFHATLGFGGEPPQIGDAAPGLIHFCLCQPAVPMDGLSEDGHPSRGGFLPPVPLPRRMWAASEIAFPGALRVGDTIRRQSRVADITVKSGRSGTLCFVMVDHEIMANGAVAITERQTIVYRGAPGKADTQPVKPPVPIGVTTEMIDVSPALLFRYSALTFNAHRIHYDLPYAVETEGYAGLVVHGPLQSTLLIQLAARCRDGAMPAAFSFRGMAPAIGGQRLGVHAGAVQDDAVELWTAPAGGAVAMRATARW